VIRANEIGVTKSAISIREASFDDHQQIALLESRYGLEPKPYKEWVHLWANNPLYRELSNWPIGWVVENEDNEIVGHIGNVPLPYEFGGEQVVAAASRALVVDAAYRSNGLLLLSSFFKQKQVDLFLATTVNDKALKGYEAFRALRAPAGTWDQAAFWVTNYLGFSTSALETKEFRGPKSFRYPLSAGLVLRDILQGRWLKTHFLGAEVDYCLEFDDRFDSFWEELRQTSPPRLLANRSRKILEWHFKYALARDEAWVLTASKGSALTAYAIFFRQDNSEFSLTRVRLVDFQALPGKTELLRPLLCHALARCRREGIHMMEALGFPPEKQRIIDGLSPSWRALSSWRYFYRTNNRQLAQELKNPQVWDPSCYDGDACL